MCIHGKVKTEEGLSDYLELELLAHLDVQGDSYMSELFSSWLQSQKNSTYIPKALKNALTDIP